MGVAPPYLYDPPGRHSTANPSYDFDPKAVTRASWSTASTSPKPRRTGPLIDFNRHPDSYLIVPNRGSDGLVPLSSRTKKTIIVTRWVQFVLRAFQLIVALGLLVCLICIKGVVDVQSWIMRVPPAWDAVIASYGLYHLIRPAKARTPGSSASYHAFALLMDISLIPFMVVTAFFSRNNWVMASGIDGRWTSFFSSSGTDTLLLVTWIAAIAVGSLHLISIAIDVYLIIIFRKIACYPPDANPLEDNLTSRLASKHRYKNSEMSVTISEKQYANMSGSTLHVNRPTSQHLLGNKSSLDANGRPVTFYQSRVNLDNSYSGHTQETARMSRADLSQQFTSVRASRADLDAYSRNGRPSTAHSHSQSRSRSRPRSQGTQNRLSIQSEHDPMPTRPMSFLSGGESAVALPSRYSTPLPGPQASVPVEVAKLQQKDGLLSDNWYVFADDDLSSPRRTPLPPHTDSDDERDDRNPHSEQLHFSRQEENDLLPQPLKTKAPTPPLRDPRRQSRSVDDTTFDSDNGAFYFSDMPSGSAHLDSYGNSHDSSIPTSSYLQSSQGDSTSDSILRGNNDDDADKNSTKSRTSQGTIGRALTISSAISAVSSLYSQGSTTNASHTASPRRKAYYGDLASATAGIRGDQLAPPPPQHGSSNLGKTHSRDRSADGSFLQRGHMEKGGRVVSRTGVDLSDASVMYLDSPTASKVSSAANSVRGRQVSGKVAEEGLAGQKSGWWGGMRRREVSGTA